MTIEELKMILKKNLQYQKQCLKNAGWKEETLRRTGGIEAIECVINDIKLLEKQKKNV